MTGEKERRLRSWVIAVIFRKMVFGRRPALGNSTRTLLVDKVHYAPHKTQDQPLGTRTGAMGTRRTERPRQRIANRRRGNEAQMPSPQPP